MPDVFTVFLNKDDDDDDDDDDDVLISLSPHPPPSPTKSITKIFRPTLKIRTKINMTISRQGSSL